MFAMPLSITRSAAVQPPGPRLSNVFTGRATSWYSLVVVGETGSVQRRACQQHAFFPRRRVGIDISRAPRLTSAAARIPPFVESIAPIQHLYHSGGSCHDFGGCPNLRWGCQVRQFVLFPVYSGAGWRLGPFIRRAHRPSSPSSLAFSFFRPPCPFPPRSGRQRCRHRAGSRTRSPMVVRPDAGAISALRSGFPA